MARAAQQEKVGFGTRLKQIGMVFAFTARRDRWFVPLATLAAIIPLALTVLAVTIWGWLVLPIGILFALLGVLIVLNLRSSAAMMKEAEGQPGAAAQIVESMRGGWRVTPAVSATTQFDMVHLAVGRRGVVLLGEGNPQRVRTLIGQEKRRLAKVIGTAPLYDFIIGPGEGEVPIRKMRMTLMRLPANQLSVKDVDSLDKRLKALTARPQLPKGAIPKNMRPPKGAFRAARGPR